MYGMPQEVGFDPSMLLMSGYLLRWCSAGSSPFAFTIGLVTLPIFFLVLYVVEQVCSWRRPSSTGTFTAKLVLIMFRGLRRSPLRTSLTYLALFVLTMVLAFIYSVLVFMDNVTKEKEANFKAIVTHRTMMPSQMPPGHYDTFKQLLPARNCPPDMQPVNGEKRHHVAGRSFSAPPTR